MNEKYKCDFCERNISKTMILRHLKTNHAEKFSNKKELGLFVFKIKNENISDFIISQIIIDYKTMSILSLVDKYNVKYNDLQKLFKIKNIKLKGLSEVNSLVSVRNKYKNTCIDKFGVENVSQAVEIKDKKANTFIEHYGVDNIFKDDKFKSTINDIIFEKYGVNRVTNYEKTKETNMERYGVEHVVQIPGVVELIKQTNLQKYGYEQSGSCPEIIQKAKDTKSNWSDERYNLFIERLSNSQSERWKNMSDDDKNKQLYRLHHTYISSIELRISNLLNTFNIEYISTYFLTNKSYDLYIKEYNLLIEVNGDFWHANPDYYKSDDLMKFPNNEKLAFEVWEKDKNKKELAEKLGYNIFYIWENKIKKSTDEELIEILLKEFEKCAQKKSNQ